MHPIAIYLVVMLGLFFVYLFLMGLKPKWFTDSGGHTPEGLVTYMWPIILWPLSIVVTPIVLIGWAIFYIGRYFSRLKWYRGE